MIAANVQAALFLEKRKIPALYRAHEPPPVEKYEDLQQFLREFKLRMPPVEEVTPGDYADILRKVHDRPEREFIQSVLLRSQSMAAYQPDNRGHFGLALAAYAHFTSPIRRYPDLLVHRAIRYACRAASRPSYTYTEAAMAAMAVHCSQRERRAEEAERDVDERFRCAWMAKHVGEEFEGTVTGVTSFGLFVELNESKVSGWCISASFQRLLPLRSGAAFVEGRAHGLAVPPGRSRACAGAAREPGRSQDRFPSRAGGQGRSRVCAD
jgi:ribonuclease R